MLFREIPAPTIPAQQGFNLLASAERLPSEGDDRWMQGVAFRSESCVDYQGFNPCAELEGLPELGGDELTYALPVGYRVRDECSTMSGRFDDQRARRMAEHVADYVVAEELWTGALSKVDPFDTPFGTGLVNPHLANEDAVTVLTAATDIMTALATLEEAVRRASRGGPAFLHGAISVIGQVGQNLERVGNELRTPTNGIVVADAGYPGTGPDGTGTGWLYGTGPIVVGLGPIRTDTAPASTIDRRTNTRQVLADRMFLATFAPCAHFAIQVTSE